MINAVKRFGDCAFFIERAGDKGVWIVMFRKGDLKAKVVAVLIGFIVGLYSRFESGSSYDALLSDIFIYCRHLNIIIS